MIQECQSNTDWAIIRSSTHLLLNIRFQKKASTTFLKWFPIWLFWAKKRRNYWPRARAEKNPDTAKKTCQIRVDTVSFLLCILLVPIALPKRERSLWLPPQNVLRQG